MSLVERAQDALNKVTKWRGVLAGWQLGTRRLGDPESDAVRDHRELSILLRVELNAVVGLMIGKGLITQDEWLQALIDEAERLDKEYERRWPGASTTADGVMFTTQAAEWLSKFPP